MSKSSNESDGISTCTFWTQVVNIVIGKLESLRSGAVIVGI